MKLHYSGFQGLQLGEVFGQGLGVVYGEAGISTCAGRPCKILQHILEVGILHVGLLPKLVFLSAGTCVVGPQAGLVVVPVEEFVAWMVLAPQPHSLGGGPPRSGPSACLRAVRAPNQRNPKSGASAESKHVETQQLKPQEAPPF